MKLIYISLVIFLSHISYGQINKTYNIGNLNTEFDQVQIFKNQLFIGGSISRYNNGKQYTPLVAKIDLNGNLINSNFSNTQNYFNNITIGKNIIDSGLVFMNSASFLDSFYLIKLDINGNQILKSSIFKSDILYITKIIQSSDLGYLLTGYGYNNSKSVSLIIKLDSKGRLIWKKNYIKQNFEYYGCDLIETNNYIYHLIEKTNSLITNSWYKNDLIIYKLNSSGDSITSWDENNYRTVGGYNDIIVTNNEDIIYSGSYNDTIIADTPKGKLSFYRKSQITKKNKLNIKLWELILGNPSNNNTFLHSIKLLRDGNILAVGENNNVTGMDSSGWGYAVKLSPQGLILWEKNFRTSFIHKSNSDYCIEYLELEDSSYMIVGNSYSVYNNDTTLTLSNQQSKGWILRINKNGEIMKESTAGISQFVQNKEPWILQNPVQNSILFNSNINEIDMISIYDIQGKKMLDFPRVKIVNNQFNIENLSSGIYFMILQDLKQGKIYQERFEKK